MLGKRRAVPRWIIGPLLCGAVGISACTAAQPPLVSRSHPEEIVPQASQYPLAELQVAREELARAQLALNAHEYEQARHLAEQASRDAQVAVARAGTENARLSAREVRQSSEAVQAVATRLASPF
jgi:uncharacterized protein DUF4398